MSSGIGPRHRAIAEGYIPTQSTSGTRRLESHETIYLLNAGDEEALIEVMVYFADPEPLKNHTSQACASAKYGQR
jgi:hypothetical protein